MLTLSYSSPSPLFSQIEIKKSKFISYLFTHSNLSQEIIKSKIKELQLEHLKANHFVYASRYLNENNQIVESFSDDSEPKNSSGLPSLSVLRGYELLQVAVITIRYFGGIKLGIGGLVRAYGSSCKEIVQIAKEKGFLHSYQLQTKCLFAIDYKNLSLIEHQLKKYNLAITQKDFSSDIALHIEGAKEDIQSFKNEFSQIINEDNV